MRFSIVIPTFNRRETLETVLPSLRNQSFAPENYEILLCDAGSTDGTAALVERLGIPNLRLLPGQDSGRAGARNRGIREARGQIVLFTDADIIADPELLEQHDESHRRHPGDAVVGCEIQVDSLAQYEDFRRNPAAHARHRPDRGTLPWHYFLTGNASVPRGSLLDVGMFDEGFTGYGHEDLELGYRLLKQGLTIRYNPRAINYHWHPVPFLEQCGKMRLAGVSTVRFYRKHRDPRIALMMGMNPVSLLVYSLFPRALVEWLTKRGERWALARDLVLQYHLIRGVREALKR